jgi:hypothetical protein
LLVNSIATSNCWDVQVADWMVRALGAGGGVHIENVILLPRGFDPSPSRAEDDSIDVTALDVTSTRHR